MTESAALSAEAPLAGRARSLFHHRDFRRLWIGDAVSQIGSEVSFLALPLVAVNTLHATVFEIGALTACETAAFLLVGLPAGAWCDRVRRRPILIAADIGRESSFVCLAGTASDCCVPPNDLSMYSARRGTTVSWVPRGTVRPW